MRPHHLFSITAALLAFATPAAAHAAGLLDAARHRPLRLVLAVALTLGVVLVVRWLARRAS